MGVRRQPRSLRGVGQRLSGSRHRARSGRRWWVNTASSCLALGEVFRSRAGPKRATELKKFVSHTYASGSLITYQVSLTQSAEYRPNRSLVAVYQHRGAMMEARVLGVRRPLQHERFSIEGILCEMVRLHTRAVHHCCNTFLFPPSRSLGGRTFLPQKARRRCSCARRTGQTTSLLRCHSVIWSPVRRCLTTRGPAAQCCPIR